MSGVASHPTTGGSQPVGREVALIRMKGGWGAYAPPALQPCSETSSVFIIKAYRAAVWESRHNYLAHRHLW